MKNLKPKKQGYGLKIQTFTGKDGATYVVFQTPSGGFNAFVETDAKDAAIDCGSTLPRSKNTRRHWQALWQTAPATKRAARQVSPGRAARVASQLAGVNRPPAVGWVTPER
ncbi:MAG: hypothetical protein WA446_18020 [Steroidobacteraceae bacterium]